MTARVTPVTMRETTDEEKKATAHHEAGHATVGLVLVPQLLHSAYVNATVAEPPSADVDLLDRRNHLGAVCYYKTYHNDRDIERLMVFYVAGRVGEVIIAGCPDGDGDRVDRKLFQELAMEHSVLRYLESDKSSQDRVVNALFERALYEAQQIVEQEILLFYVLTNRLSRYGELNDKALLETLSEFSTGRTYEPLLFRYSS